ncbi:MAG TPA: hypothetical protein VJ180_16230 [Pyrinomonadaceae bacterium]|nr:hypothetical protein [Pyrinomonadaceae bacterium]
MHIVKPHWPLFAAAGLLFVIVAVQLTLSIRKNQGHFVYALDDPYIHMAIARNFARHGVWGVTRYEFSSSTSSLMLTLLLAAAYFFTSSEYVPLIFNIACAIVLLAVAYSLLEPLSSFAKLALISSLVLLLPLPALIFSGMEHTAHIALSLPLVYAAASVITLEQIPLRRRRLWLLLLLSAFAPLVRYESLFLILPTALLVGLRRRFREAALVLLVALVPLTVYGLISWSYGSSFLPNPLVLKGSMPRDGILPFLQQALFKFRSAPHLWSMLLLAIWFFIGAKTPGRIGPAERVLALIFILATVLHLLFAGIGWFYRYEAYLVAIGIMITGQSVFKALTGRKEDGAMRGAPLLPVTLTLALSLVSGITLLVRANRAISDTIPAMKNIYNQQYQMARFLETYYSGEAVAANDIGAINFMSDVRCLDLWGLGSVEVTRAKLAGAFNTIKIAELATSHQVRIALLYSVWFQGDESVPESWIKVGQWTIQECVVCGYPTVSFYAVDTNEADTLKQNLQAFSAKLPADVIQGGAYYETK